MKTGRFGNQPERSVFPVWVLTGFACYSARKYYQNGTEIQSDMLEDVLGVHKIDGAPNSGTGTAELGLFYALEAIIVFLGIVFIRYFLTD